MMKMGGWRTETGDRRQEAENRRIETGNRRRNVVEFRVAETKTVLELMAKS